MFPLKDDNPAHKPPIFTVTIIIINCLIHFYKMTLPETASMYFTYQFGLIPLEIINFADLTTDAPFPVWLSPFSSMFIHGDLMHLLGNMLFLWIFGNNIEDHLGHVRFVGFYLISGLAAVALFIVFNPIGRAPLIGASGAIAGVLGAYAVLYPRARVLTLIWIIFFIRLAWLPAMIILGYWFFIQMFMAITNIGMGSQGGVAWFAHVGGFAFGWILARFRYKKMVPEQYRDDDGYYNRWHK